MEPSEDPEPARQRSPIHRSVGLTDSERYLKKLCQRSFLTMWSYPGVFRDQGHTKNGGDGKEVCDLLVVFENHIIIFSDKYCEFKNSGNLQIDWSRWYRAAITDAAKQIWGAERWIKQYPERLFLNSLCTQPFPFPLPNPATANFHRVIVAHGASERCKQELGGSGSLMIVANEFGPMSLGVAGAMPFTIGQVDPKKGFVHIFDDTTLDVVLKTLDTVSDFVSYLIKKEKFISSDRLLSAAGEEELLACYLVKMNAQGEHDFMFPPEANFIVLGEGHWAEFITNAQRHAQIEANKVSYAWDKLIEKFNKNVLADTLYQGSETELKLHEENLRWLARETRTRRRLLANGFMSLIAKTPPGKHGTRVIKPSSPGDPYYVFHLFPLLSDWSYAEYRELRRKLLEQYCMVAKVKCPDAQHIIGIATETKPEAGTSEDIVYLDTTEWSQEAKAEAQRLHKELGLFRNINESGTIVQEYPEVNNVSSRAKSKTSNETNLNCSFDNIGRNDRCPCGSGQKYKRCHGR